MTKESARPDAPPVTVHLLRGRAARSAQAMHGATLLLGADAQCDVQLRSPEVAAKHCLLSRRDGRVLATRLDVHHPVFRNGAPIAEEELSAGDELTIGPFALRVAFETAIAAEGFDAGAERMKDEG